MGSTNGAPHSPVLEVLEAYPGTRITRKTKLGRTGKHATCPWHAGLRGWSGTQWPGTADWVPARPCLPFQTRYTGECYCCAAKRPERGTGRTIRFRGACVAGHTQEVLKPLPGSHPHVHGACGTSAVGSDDSRPREACGVVGVYAPDEDVARVAYFGLFALQHRGQESAGIATTDGVQLSLHASMGLVSQAFDEPRLARLAGHMAIGHTRYSTMGASKSRNAQPVVTEGINGELALGHNGNVINAAQIRSELEGWGCSFDASSDSEVIAALYANAPGLTWEERSAYCMRKLRGAYTLVMLTRDAVVGVRDPLGIRPLCLGRLNGGGHVLASETCALKHLGAEFEREIMPGETVVLDASGVHSTVWSGARNEHAMCIFEHIYFARPDSILAGRLAYSTRMAMGAQLVKEHPVDADLVIGVPDSATAAATGYSRESGITFGEGFVKNRYVGRTFIEPDQRLRDLGVQMKFNTLPELISGRRVVVVDDSIVRGTTTPPVLRLLREAGASEIHMRVCAPPIVAPCHFGVDMGRLDELIAARNSVEEIRRHIGADSLGFLSLEGLLKAVEVDDSSFCRGCFTGRYPIPVQLEMDKMQMEPPEPAAVS